MTYDAQQLDLPCGWAWANIGEVATIVGGGTPKTSDPANFDGGEVPWITPADLSGYREKFITQGARNITEKGLKNSSARMMPAGTVLFSSRAPIGYVAIASQPVTTNQGFKSFVLPGDIDPSYTYYYLQTARELVESLSGGTTFKEISGANAARIPFAIAPLPEQHRIVAEIEKQFTRLDASVAALRRTQANLKRYRASTLRAACSGELVPTEAELARAEGREYEPARVLLERILAERRARWESQEKRRGKYKEPAAPDTSGLPPLPEGWAWANLDQSCVVNPRSFTASVVDETSISFVPMAMVEAETGIIHLNQTRPYSEVKKGYTRFSEGDVLFAKITPCMENGKAAIAQGLTNGSGCGSTEFHVLRPLAGLSKEYTLYFLLRSEFRRDAQRNMAGTAGQLRVPASFLERAPFPLPPTSEQRRIVAEVERRLSVVQQAEAAVDASLQRAEWLRQSILKRAFSGELVPQDPDDEPASVLLERIRAQREAEQAAATASKKRPARRRQASSQS